MSAAGSDGPGAALEMRSVTKRFGDVPALEHVDFSARPGRVHALLGENGAGKSTLMRIAYGLTSPDSGSVRVFDRSLVDASVRDATRAGVGMVHQHLTLVAAFTVAENLVLGGHGRYQPGVASALLQRTAEASGLRLTPEALGRDLSIVEQQRLEILKAVARGARLLILDEPTAVLAPAEVDDLLRWIRSFVAGGGTVVLVTHKLREALAIADDVTVLRRGRVVYTGLASDSSERSLAGVIFPADSDTSDAPGETAPGAVVVDASAIELLDERGRRAIRSASFAFRRHEIIGVAAVEGSGHRELLAALAGLRPSVAGSLRLPQHIGLIPGDRSRDALIADFSLAENVGLRDVGRRRGLMPWQLIATRTAGLMAKFNIAAPSPRVPARSLSGGNQQRLVVARELEHDTDLVIADNATRGLDIRATTFVQRQLRDAAARGAAVVVHSSDLDEVLALATRVLVVFAGNVVEVAKDRARIGMAMLGVGGAGAGGPA